MLKKNNNNKTHSSFRMLTKFQNTCFLSIGRILFDNSRCFSNSEEYLSKEEETSIAMTKALPIITVSPVSLRRALNAASNGFPRSKLKKRVNP